MYESTCYRSNFLDEVILRLDFANIINELKNAMPKEINDVIKRYYPIAEPEDVIGSELQLITTSSISKQKKWVFYSRDRQQRCSIEDSAIIFSAKNYNIYEDFRNTSLEIIDIIAKKYEDISIKRLGFRFVNNIKIERHKEYIVPSIMDSFPSGQIDLLRALTTVEYISEDQEFNVRKQYGYANPDYPSPMKNDNFLIDIDTYTTGLVYFEDVEKIMDKMHSEIQNSFETSITDVLRTQMNK